MKSHLGISGRHATVALLLIASMASTWAQDAKSPWQPVPEDVRSFIEKRNQCDQWRGEDPYDRYRAKEIDRHLNRFCKGSDRQLAQLKRRYQDQPVVVRVLADFDPAIE
ncbi:hypothetical protein GN316_14055 [Xylophilus sp. Kf1]|nr:hypothetical protein [Xylophilus sp. Kf1]